MMATTTIERVPCNMAPDPCDQQDYIATGVDIYGGEFSARIHNRGRRCWTVANADLRQDWKTFASLNACVAWLEGDF